MEISGPSPKETTEFKQEKAVSVIVNDKEESQANGKPKKEEIAPFFGRVQNLHIACMLNVETSNLLSRSFDKSMENFNVNGLEQLGTEEGTHECDPARSKEQPDEEIGRDEIMLSHVRSVKPEDSRWPFLLRFQVVSIGAAMGISSHAVLWKSLAESESVDFAGIPKQISIAYWILGVFILSAIFSIYALKCIFYPAAVALEFRHPFRVNFFFGFTLATFFLLQAIPEGIDSLTGSRIVYGISASVNLILQVTVYSQWLTDPERSLSRFANPPYQIAVVGNFVSAGVAISLDWRDVGLFFLGVGVVFQSIVLASLFQRFDSLKKSIDKKLSKQTDCKAFKSEIQRAETALYQSTNHPCRHEDFLTSFKNSIWDIPQLFSVAFSLLSDTAQDTSPVFFLFVAPPSAAAASFAALNGEFGDGPRMLLFFALFLYLMFAVQIKLFLFAQRHFSLAWWAYTFPQAAVAGAAISYASAQDTRFLEVLAFGLSIIAVVIQVRTMIATFWRLFMGTLFPIDGLLKPWTSLAKHYTDNAANISIMIDLDIQHNQHSVE